MKTDLACAFGFHDFVCTEEKLYSYRLVYVLANVQRPPHSISPRTIDQTLASKTHVPNFCAP